MIDAANTLPLRGRVGPKVRGGVTRRFQKTKPIRQRSKVVEVGPVSGVHPHQPLCGAPPQEGGWSLTNDGEAFGLCAPRHRHWRAADPLDVALQDAGGFCRVA